jgi:hypothetical protein
VVVVVSNTMIGADRMSKRGEILKGLRHASEPLIGDKTLPDAQAAVAFARSDLDMKARATIEQFGAAMLGAYRQATQRGKADAKATEARLETLFGPSASSWRNDPHPAASWITSVTPSARTIVAGASPRDVAPAARRGVALVADYLQYLDG